MTTFEESALRNSVSTDPNAAAIPCWPSSSRFPELGDMQQELPPPVANMDRTFNTTFDGSQMAMPGAMTSMNFDLAPDGYRPMGYAPYDDLAEVSRELSQALGSLDQGPPSALAHLPKRMSVKTPTGPRNMRRPGLAGASALVNGQYCCQWSMHGITCDLKFADAKALNDHIRAQHVRGAATFICQWTGCDKGGFPTANKLVRHVHSHTGYKPFPCMHCPQAFVTKDQLDKHLTTHTGAKDFVCTWPGCGRSFAVKHALDGHMNSVHLKAKKHVCPHCMQAFDDSSNLSKHKKQVHNKDTGIQCPGRHTHGCMYVDSRKDKMKEHCEREQHGLEIVHDAHAWSMWVQRFKSSTKKHCHRRQSRSVCAHSHAHVHSHPHGHMHPHSHMHTPMSNYTDMSSASSFTIPDYHHGACSKQICEMPMCMPCDSFCPDMTLHALAHHHQSDLQHCTSHHHCDDPCSTQCDPCDPCEPCEPCDDAHCEPCEPCEDDDCENVHCDDDDCSRQPCHGGDGGVDDGGDDGTASTQSCRDPHHCRSSPSSPSSHPSTPRGGGGGVAAENYFTYGAIPGGEEADLFPNSEHAFPIGAGQLQEFMYMS